MTDWVAVSVDVHDDLRTVALSEKLGISLDAAIARLVRLWGRMARQGNETGYIGNVPDLTLEDWAGWRGMPGAFAPAYREIFTEDGTVRRWFWWNGRHLKKARQERDRKRKARGWDAPPDEDTDSPADSPADKAADRPPDSPPDSRPTAENRGLSGGMSADCPATIPEPEPIPTTQHSTAARFTRLLSRLPDTGGARWAVTEFLEAQPQPDGWVGPLLSLLEGIGTPGGQPCPPAVLVQVCQDFGTKQPHEVNPRFFRICVAAEMKTQAAPGGPVVSRRVIAGGLTETLARQAADRRSGGTDDHQ